MTQNIPQNLNLLPSNVDLKTLLDYWGKQLKLEFNCHHVGTIQSFSSVTQTATATINYTKAFQEIDSVGALNMTSQSYPVLIDCPCLVLGGGGAYLSFPISSGDECLVLFNDRDFDNWYAGSTGAPPATPRLHSYPDAIILVGLRSLSNVILDYDTAALTLYYKENTIKIASDKVTVDLSATTSLELTESGSLAITNATGEFVSALAQLFSDIESATTNTIFGPQLLIMPTFTTDLAVFNSFKS